MSMSFLSFSDDAWSDAPDREELAIRVGAIDGHLVIRSDVHVRQRSLPMYETARLLCLTSPSWNPSLRICYLDDQGALYRLNGTSPPIHQLNAKAPIRMDEVSAAYYLSFFTFFVRGEEGPFYVVHDLADELLPDGFADARPTHGRDLRTPRELFRPPKYWGKEEKGWRFSALMHYSNALFYTDFLVWPTGMMEMVDDQPILGDLPCQVTAPLAATS